MSNDEVDDKGDADANDESSDSETHVDDCQQHTRSDSNSTDTPTCQ